jgi:predicted nuclease with TOPRIM domain
MTENVLTIVITGITVLFGAGAWKFYEFLIRNKRDKQKEELKEQTVYRDDLKARVEKLENSKDSCMNDLLEISKELAALKVKIEFIEKENDRLLRR